MGRVHQMFVTGRVKLFPTEKNGLNSICDEDIELCFI